MTDIARAAALLRAGELVAFPTETVYGLGADATNPAAVANIFTAKGRPADHPLIVHLPSVSHLGRWARDVPAAAYALAAAFWPGPLTLILKRQPGGVPDTVTGGQDTVGLRVPNHPLALALLREFDGGIAAPSANRYGRISPTQAQHVVDELGTRVAMVLDGGACSVGIESTILDLSTATPRILRPGMIDATMIAGVLGQRPAQQGDTAPRVPGSVAAHYAPRTPMQRVPSAALATVLAQALEHGKRIAVLAFQPAPANLSNIAAWRVIDPDPAGFAHALYADLRELDAQNCDLILVEAPPETEDWLALADRLGRAVVGSGTP
jgi:L-threonylcarbamoyladenylate synthase